MKEALETLFQWNRGLLGEGYDNALMYIKTLIGLDVIEIPSGTRLGTWTVPDEWIVRGATLSSGGETILDYATNPLSLVQSSLPFTGVVNHEELLKHIHTSSDNPDDTPYVFKFYDRDWGFSMPENEAKKLTEGDYMVQIETEDKPGTMKIGVHTIKGKSDREILLFAHLDHPFQANDNLSGVVCLLDLANKIKCEHTVKLIFCPETIGSIGYALTQDLSKVDFMLAVDVCGNENTILLQKSWDPEDRLNKVAHAATQAMGKSYRKGMFRNVVGSDEYVFNDPEIGIPGLMISTWPFPEYHTDKDTPEKIDYDAIEGVSQLIRKIIEIYEADFIPVRKFKGPLMRSRYGMQTVSQQFNLAWDYLIYHMDGKKSLAELASDHGLDFDSALIAINKMIDDNAVTRLDARQEPVKKAAKQKHSGVSRKTNVRGKSKKVS